MSQPDTAFPRFFRAAQQNNIKSAAMGHPVYDDVEKVEVIIPGQTLSIPTLYVTQEHRDRWPIQYAAFKAGLEAVTEGTPIEQWPPLTPAQVANLKAINILSVEALSAVPDSALPSIGMGARALRDKAAAWLEQAAGGEPLSKALAAIEALKSELETMKASHDDFRVAVERDAQEKRAGASAG